MRFITNEPALMVGRTLVIADLHLGMERELFRKGVRLPTQTPRILQHVLKLVKETRCSELVIIGDLKHNIVGAEWDEKQELIRFIEEIKKHVPVRLIKGNHDGAIESYLDVPVSPGSGFAVGNVWLFHGHAKPGKGSERCSTLIMGHVHPIIEFTDSLGGRMQEKVWVRGTLDTKQELVIMPAFSHLLGGVDVREGLLGPMKKHLAVGQAKVYLLDSLCIGTIGDLSEASHRRKKGPKTAKRKTGRPSGARRSRII